MFSRKTSFLILVFTVIAGANVASPAVVCTGSSTITCTGGPAASVTGTTALTAAVPYPSTITVPSTYAGSTVTGVSVRLNGLNADANNGFGVQLVNMALVGPNGKAFEILGNPGNGSQTFTSVTFNISDSAGSAMPVQGAAFGSPCTSTACTGTLTLKPTSSENNGNPQYVGASPAIPSISFPAALGSSTFASIFTGASATGDWKLYMSDGYQSSLTIGNNDSINFSSWDLILTVSTTLGSTTTSLVSSQNPSFAAGANSSVNLTANVAPNTATGTVSFSLDGTPISGCTASTVSSGVAHCNSQTFTQGNHTIVATYSGDASNATSTSAPLIQYSKVHSTLTAGQYCNTGAISISESAGGTITSPVYPSVINVGTDTTGIAQAVASVGVTLKGFSSSFVGNVQAVLVGPNGRNLAFMNGVGNGNQSSLDVTFTDSSSHGLAPLNSTLTQADYVPTAYSAVTSNIPQPPGGSGIEPQLPVSINVPATAGGANAKTFTTAFNGGTSNGDWALFLYFSNDPGGTAAASGGWCLNITPAVGTATNLSVSGSPNAAPPSGAGVSSTVTVTATVTNANNSASVGNVGTVTFTEGGNPVAGAPNNGVVSVASGKAIFTTSSLTEGDHTILATYNDSTNTFSTSFNTFVQRVDRATTGPTVNGNVISYCNTGSLAIPGLTNADTSGAGGPNPSNIFVSGLPGTINHTTVSLKGYHTSAGYETRSLLVGPTGANLDFLSDAGGSVNFGPVNVMLDDSAGSLAPQSALASGSYKPASYDSPHTFTPSSSGFFTLPGSFTYAAPDGSATLSSIFGSGTNSTTSPDGLWSLYFFQNIASPSHGLDNGWCLNFTMNQPQLTASKTHRGFTVGQTGTYTIQVGNSGPGPTGGGLVTVSDPLPTGFTQSNIDGGTDWTCTTSTTTTITCTSTSSIAASGSFAPIVITVTPDSTSGTTGVVNTATVSGFGMIAPVSAVTDTSTVTHPPVLSVAIADNGNPTHTFAQGDTGKTFTVTVNNAANSGSTSGTVNVALTLTSGLTGAVVTFPGGSGWTCTLLTCMNSNVLTAGSSFGALTVTFNVASNASSAQSLTAAVTGGGTGANSPSSTDNVTILQPPTISEAFSPASININGTSSLTFTLSNPNTIDLTGAAFTQALATNVTTNAATVTGTCGATPGTLAANLTSLSFTAITIPHGGSCTVIVSVTDNQFGTATNPTSSGVTTVQTTTAGIGATGASLTVSRPDYASSTLTDSGGGTFAQGDQGRTFTLTVTNGAASGTSNGTITAAVTVPAGLLNPVITFPGGSGWSCVSLTCTNSNALTQGSGLGALTVTVNVDPQAASPQPVLATISGAGASAATNLSDSVTITQLPRLTVQKTHAGPFVAGDAIAAGDSFTLTISNTGSATATTAKVVDTFNASFTLGTLPSGCLAAAQTVTCNPASIAPSNSATFVIPVAVAQAASGNISNSATVSCTTACLIATPTVNDSVSITQIPVYALALSDNGSPAHTFSQHDTGKTVTATLTTSGLATSGTVTVVFTVPSGLSATGLTGPGGWNCASTSCNTTSVVPTGSNLQFVLTFSVGGGATTPQSVAASVSGGGGNSVNATPDSLTILQVGDQAQSSINGGGTQSAPVNAAFATALAVLIRDSAGNPINNYPVTFTAPQSGPSATFVSNTVNANPSGIASATATANALAGAYNVTASAGPVSLTFNLTNTATPIVTATALPSPLNFSTSTQQVQLNATVAGGAAGTVNSGSVTFTITDPSSVQYTVGPVAVTNGAITQTPFTVPANPTLGLWSVSPAFTGGGAFLNATGTLTTFTVAKANNVITFPQPSDTALTSSPVTLTATSSSGLAVTYGTNTSSICTVSGSLVTLINVGQCSITASQAGNSNYSAATSVTQTFQVLQGVNTITFNTPPNHTVGDSPFTVTATASSGLTVTFSGGTASVCSVTSVGQVTILGGGICSITANQAGSANYAAATPVTKTFQVGQASQTINFTNPGTQLAGAIVTLSATATSSLTVSFATLSPSVCTVSGTQATMIGIGQCSIQATQAGNASYFAATPVTQNFTVIASDLSIAKSHVGHFSQGQTDATYTLTVSNIGTGPTNGTQVTVSDTLPASLTATAIAGLGWNCNLGTLSCARTDVLASGSSYSAITVTVTVSNTAPASVTNQALVAGGGEVNIGNDTASDPTVVNEIQDVSAQVKVTSSGFGRNHSTGLWSSTMTVTNTSAATITGPIQVVLTNITAGVSMTNNTGLRNGIPYITVTPSSLAPGASVNVMIQFSNPANGFIAFTPLTLTGAF